MSITGLSVSVLFSNLAGLFLLIGVGFVLVRADMLPRAAVPHLTTLMMKVTVPATVFSSMIRPFELDFLKSALMIFVLGFLFTLLYAAVSWGLAHMFRVRKGGRGMWMMCGTFCNSGFMGFPIAYALFGDEGLALAAMVGIAFNLLLYTVGARMLLLDRKGGKELHKVPWKHVIFSTVNLATILGLVFYGLQIPVPAAVLTPIQYLANITTPLSMLITGMNLANGGIVEALRDRDAATASLTRLLVFPVLTWAVLCLMPISNELVKSVFLLIISMPCAAMSVVMAEEYHGNAELGARIVFLSSLLCIVTIPLISLLL